MHICIVKPTSWSNCETTWGGELEKLKFSNTTIRSQCRSSRPLLDMTFKYFPIFAHANLTSICASITASLILVAAKHSDRWTLPFFRTATGRKNDLDHKWRQKRPLHTTVKLSEDISHLRSCHCFQQLSFPHLEFPMIVFAFAVVLFNVFCFQKWGALKVNRRLSLCHLCYKQGVLVWYSTYLQPEKQKCIARFFVSL